MLEGVLEQRHNTRILPIRLRRVVGSAAFTISIIGAGGAIGFVGGYVGYNAMDFFVNKAANERYCRDVGELTELGGHGPNYSRGGVCMSLVGNGRLEQIRQEQENGK